MSSLDSRWLQIDVERELYVDRGRDVILCDRSHAPNGQTLLVRVSPEAVADIKRQLSMGGNV